MIEAKYIDLSEKIAEKIRNGEWKERMPGVIKLSKELNVNPATVAKAFKVLADKGLLTIDGTKGTFITQPGRRVKYKLIGVVGLSERDAHSDEWQIMERAAQKVGYRIIGISHNNELFAKDIGLLLQFPVDGYIFLYSSMTAEIAEFLRKNGISFVACSNTVGIPGVNYVDFDPENIFEKSLRYMLELGHRRIAYIEFNSRKYKYSERILEVYKKVLAEFNVPFDSALFISMDKTSYVDKCGFEAAYYYGHDCADIIRKEKPGAAILSMNHMGKGLIDGLKKHKIKCPEDISIIVYGPKNGAEEFFTHIQLDYQKRAGLAIDMIINMLENVPLKNSQVLISSDLVPGKSTAVFKP